MKDDPEVVGSAYSMPAFARKVDSTALEKVQPAEDDDLEILRQEHGVSSLSVKLRISLKAD